MRFSLSPLYSRNVLGKKLLPLVQRPPGTSILHNAIKNHCRTNMDAHQAVHLGDKLYVVGHGIACVQRSVLADLVRNGQQLVDFILTNTNLGGDFSQATVGLITGFSNDTDVVEFGLHCEELATESPELLGSQTQHREPGLMHQRRRWVPWLHLLAEDDGEAIGPDGILANDWENLGCERLENLRREGAAVVEEELKGVSCARDRRA